MSADFASALLLRPKWWVMASDDIPIGPDESAVPLTADQLYDALLRIPSQFERLVYLASLATSPASNWQTGDIELFWREVRSEHVTVFEGWLPEWGFRIVDPSLLTMAE